MKYEYKDIFIKTCNGDINNNIVCHKSRSSSQCIDGICNDTLDRNVMPTKIDLLKEFQIGGSGKFNCHKCDFSTNEFEKFTNHVHLNKLYNDFNKIMQIGDSGKRRKYDNEILQLLLKNHIKKYTCPYCNILIIEDIKSHLDNHIQGNMSIPMSRHKRYDSEI